MNKVYTVGAKFTMSVWSDMCGVAALVFYFGFFSVLLIVASASRNTVVSLSGAAVALVIAEWLLSLGGKKSLRPVYGWVRMLAMVIALALECAAAVVYAVNSGARKWSDGDIYLCVLGVLAGVISLFELYQSFQYWVQVKLISQKFNGYKKGGASELQTVIVSEGPDTEPLISHVLNPESVRKKNAPKKTTKTTDQIPYEPIFSLSKL